MRKNILTIIFTITIFFAIIPSVKASYGELRYEITDFGISGTRITFSGWAFLHRTHNYVTYNGGDTSIPSDGGQKIRIRAVTEGSNQILEEITVTGGGSYNFYCQMYNHKKDKAECKNAYQGSFGDPLKKGGPANDFYGFGSNKCGMADNSSDQCLYEDLGFNITLNVDNWDVDPGVDIIFKIGVYNNDYGTWKETTLGITSRITPANDNPNIELVESGSSNNKLRVIASTGLLKTVNDQYLYNNAGRIVAQQGGVYTIANNVTVGAYTNGYAPPTTNELGNGYNPGRYLVYTKKTSSASGRVLGPASNSEISNGNYQTLSVMSSWVVPSATLKIRKKGNQTEASCNIQIGLGCNGTASGESTCSTTVTGSAGDGGATASIGDKRATVRSTYSINQSISLANILTPTTTYAGGGFKFGILYHNDITWSQGDISTKCEEYEHEYDWRRVCGESCKACNRNYTCNQETGSCPSKTDWASSCITNYGELVDQGSDKWKTKSCSGYGTLINRAISDMEDNFSNRIKDEDSFKRNMNLIANMNGDSLANYNKECSYNNSTEGKIEAKCLFYLPESYLSPYTGKVSYGAAGGDLNNKYYTPIIWNESDNPFTVRAQITGLNMLKENSSESWENWDTNLSCEVNLYPLYGTKAYDNGKESLKYVFIYRPIDLQDPFPRRSPGMNWYDWYSSPSRQRRLETSYERLQYSITLDSKKVSDIKKYNRTAKDYLNWQGIQNGKSDFVNEYFTKKRENIVGDY